MKKIFYILPIISFLYTTQIFAIRENKIIRVGYVNYSKLVEKVDQDGSIQKKINSIRETYSSNIGQLTQEVQKLQQTVASDSNSENISNYIHKLEEKTLELELLKIKSIQEIEKFTNTALEMLNEKIKPAIANIAKRQNFDIIIDSSLILLGSASLDITNVVLATL